MVTFVNEINTELDSCHFPDKSDYGVMTDLPNRIRELRRSSGLSQEKLADKTGTTKVTIGRLETGERQLTLSWMKKISHALGVSTAELIDGDIGPQNLQAETKKIPVIGEVQAGVWREALEWPEDERYGVSIPFESADHAANAYGLVVAGNSMDRVYPDGTILIVMPVHKYPHKIASGDNVIVRRTRSGVTESTVKELQIKKGKAELWPRSTNPKHVEPINIHWPYDSAYQSDVETVEITAIVVGSYKMEKKL